MKRDILFIGSLEYPNIPKAGDSVKNQFLMEFFRQYRTVDYIDTFQWRRRPWVLLRVLWSLCFGAYKNIVYSVSNESAYHLTRLFTTIPHRKRVIYSMIGGYTPVKIKQGIYQAEPFRKLDKILVEADKVVDMYEALGIYNAKRVYNFKPYSYLPDVRVAHTDSVKFVFLSRLTELKGVFLILQAVDILNERGFQGQYEVDFYGAIMPEIHDRFLSEVARYNEVRYNGFLNLRVEKNYTILSQYDAMLFPTMHPTEGFPGVIADAAIAGVPVIASAWNYADELVAQPQSGYVIPVGDVEALANQMQYVVEHRDENERLRANCLHAAENYKMENVLTPGLLQELGI